MYVSAVKKKSNEVKSNTTILGLSMLSHFQLMFQAFLVGVTHFIGNKE